MSGGVGCVIEVMSLEPRRSQIESLSAEEWSTETTMMAEAEAKELPTTDRSVSLWEPAFSPLPFSLFALPSRWHNTISIMTRLLENLSVGLWQT
ncbi:hypothetical protein M9H77_34086 [Catharanthus roseus]|uniref:Uncharacterized protein n=1 Tax=Catharanthus roseus TaxID=4058 RepID=A0ACB9ZK44_CATRO|nr:hypothetical protein M9H77_34086 [Catharanthus roseus]